MARIVVGTFVIGSFRSTIVFDDETDSLRFGSDSASPWRAVSFNGSTERTAFLEIIQRDKALRAAQHAMFAIKIERPQDTDASEQMAEAQRLAQLNLDIAKAAYIAAAPILVNCVRLNGTRLVVDIGSGEIAHVPDPPTALLTPRS